MKTTEFTMPEITISYKDNVKASERMKILSSQTSYSYLKPFYSECMEHHEESYVMFLNRANKALGVSLISKGGMAETVMDVKIILQTALKVQYPPRHIPSEVRLFLLPKLCQWVDYRQVDILLF